MVGRQGLPVSQACFPTSGGDQGYLAFPFTTGRGLLAADMPGPWAGC